MPDGVSILFVLLVALVLAAIGMAAAEHFYGVTVPRIVRRLRRGRDGGDS